VNANTVASTEAGVILLMTTPAGITPNANYKGPKEVEPSTIHQMSGIPILIFQRKTRAKSKIVDIT
jgi:hypothetical protein